MCLFSFLFFFFPFIFIEDSICEAIVHGRVSDCVHHHRSALSGARTNPSCTKRE